MKTLNYFSRESGLFLRLLLILLFFTPGCTKQELAPEYLNKNLNEMNIKSAVGHEGTHQLEGFTRFAFYAKKEGRYITDGYTDNYLACEAELIFADHQDFTLITKEYMDIGAGPILFREVTFNGKMTPSGQLKFTWPETWIQLGAQTTDVLGTMAEHTGMSFSGKGVNKNTLEYMGSYNGNKFFADIHITGIQEQPGTLPFFLEIVDGPVLINFMIDLVVAD